MKVFFVKNNNRIIVYFKFHRKIISIIKEIDGYQFNNNGKFWSIPFQNVGDLEKKLEESSIEYIYDDNINDSDEHIVTQSQNLDNKLNIKVNFLSKNRVEFNNPIAKEVYFILKKIPNINWRANSVILENNQLSSFFDLCNNNNIQILN
jgi:hypothetical protein